MDKYYFDDLKQFIQAELSQREARVEARLTARMEAGFAAVRQDMRDGFDGVAAAIDTVNQLHDEDQQMTERRLRRLEQRLT